MNLYNPHSKQVLVGTPFRRPCLHQPRRKASRVTFKFPTSCPLTRDVSSEGLACISRGGKRPELLLVFVGEEIQKF